MAALAATAALAPARADFGVPVTLSAAGRDAFQPQVAVDRNGNAVVVWPRFDGANYRIQARARSAMGALGPIQNFSQAGVSAFGAQVAVDRHGNAVVVWTRVDGTIQARGRSAAGALGPIQNLSQANRDAFDPQVAIRDNGIDAVGVWYRDDGANYRIQARTRTAGGALGSIQTLSQPGQDAFGPQVALDANGNAVVVWFRSDGTNFRVQARTRSAAGVLGPIRTLSQAGQNAINPQVAVDANGNAVVVWSRSDGMRSRIQARTFSAGSVLGPIRTLSQAGQNAINPQVAVRPNGNAVVVWSRFDGADDRIQARTFSAGGALGPIRNLSPTGRDAADPQVALRRNGDAAVVVWSRSDGTNDRVQARTLSTASMLSPIQNLSRPGRNANVPQVAVDIQGDALAVWARLDAAANSRIQAAAGP